MAVEVLAPGLGGGSSWEKGLIQGHTATGGRARLAPSFVLYNNLCMSSKYLCIK